MLLLEKIFNLSVEAALLPTILLVVFYILLYRRMRSFESSVRSTLETHIPENVFLPTPAKIESEFVRAVSDADKFVMTTGGKSHISGYLEAIEKTIETKQVEYYRVVDRRVSKEMREHLSRVVGKHGVYVSFSERDLGPSLLLTETVAFIGLPDPAPGELKACLKIPDEKIIENLAKLIRIWYGESEKRLMSKSDIDMIVGS